MWCIFFRPNHQAVIFDIILLNLLRMMLMQRTPAHWLPEPLCALTVLVCWLCTALVCWLFTTLCRLDHPTHQHYIAQHKPVQHHQHGVLTFSNNFLQEIVSLERNEKKRIINSFFIKLIFSPCIRVIGQDISDSACDLDSVSNWQNILPSWTTLCSELDSWLYKFSLHI